MTTEWHPQSAINHPVNIERKKEKLANSPAKQLKIGLLFLSVVKLLYHLFRSSPLPSASSTKSIPIIYQTINEIIVSTSSFIDTSVHYQYLLQSPSTKHSGPL
ncbi:hypothetical protein DERF_014257 [Dermatophagoides farinae]|uniref:Uncharacterized protein n=1 Tax=Dermatophagoides farinae TaxID=6954 RepID=A0A922HLT3_DERFA|nr:hypothetical protein DERF_014257 [Dermatophagoides farinae]